MRIFDTLANLITGMGTDRSKSAATTYAFAPMTPIELEAAYRGSWLARKVIDIPAMDACREWRDWQAGDDEIEKIEAEEKRLNVRGRVLEAKIKARLYGGAAILIGDGSADQAEELRPDRLGRGGIRYLPVLTWQRLSAGEIETDVSSPWYGQPKSYTLQSARAGQVDIHPSRIVRFVGAPLPDVETAASMSWGDSVLEAVSRALKSAEGTAENVAGLTHEAKVDVLRIPNLMTLAADPDYESRFQRRTQLAMMAKSLHNTLILDAEEEYEQKQIDFATLPEVIDRMMQIAAGAADIPLTRLLGQSPAGMNATGESDLRNYYDRVSSGQELEMQPALSILDECLIRSALGSRPKEIYYEWAPLWQMSETDKADVALKKAQAFQIDINSGAFPDSALSKARINQVTEDGLYPGIEAAMDEAEAEGDAIDFGEKAESAAQMPDPAQVLRMQAAANDAEPRTLYVRRSVKNAADIIVWARGQGFETTLPADAMHVTIAFSRAPVDWMKIGEAWASELKIAAGGPRLMERFGDATVLLFKASELEWRHEAIREAGASWDHPEYQPHITISYGFKGDLDTIEPYQGEIVLGPEIFEEVEED